MNACLYTLTWTPKRKSWLYKHSQLNLRLSFQLLDIFDLDINELPSVKEVDDGLDGKI